MENTAKKYTTRKEFFKQYKKKSRMQEIWRMFCKNKLAIVGLI
ncbi:MAG TPA: ABC transporter permease, partial [Clostridia bacterium]|nr:ABC transporter permease [Clostridia bacterium]